MTNLIAVLIGALISTVTAWSLKAREMRWQYHRVSLERLEELAELAFIVSAHYDRRQKFWLQRLRGYDKTPASELVGERRPKELDRMLTLIPFHAPEMHGLMNDLHARSCEFSDATLELLAAERADVEVAPLPGLTVGAAPMNEAYAKIENAAGAISRLAWYVVDSAASVAGRRVRKQTRPFWNETKSLRRAFFGRLRGRKAGGGPK